MASGSKFSFSDMRNPLFLHPSDNPLSISVTKLQGAGDYRTWKRSMEIQLSSKRKLGFVTGLEVGSVTDATEALQWDTCNSMKQLETRFHLTHGSRKYKLSKEVYALKQNGSPVNDYFTSLSSLWVELDSMNLLPAITTDSDDVSKLLKAIHTQKEECKLFQFLNGLDDVYGPQRSQLLMTVPLPSVEMACAAIQQEESQRDVLKSSFPYENEMSVMFTKSSASTDRPFSCTIGICFVSMA
ncbi:uncharacterized protein LOC141683731 [Apium graveolens]|uniref:uncharacterized protein LOC141683731 n=1 Tax=Apium graveolens TaxID=4045 RepID=UPI003D78C527